MFERIKTFFGTTSGEGAAEKPSKPAIDDGFAERLVGLRMEIDDKFGGATVAGTWPRRVSASLLTRGGRPALLSIALIAPEGDLQSAIVIGLISAETRSAKIDTLAQTAANHLAGVKGVLDVESASYEALALDLVAFLEARGVSVNRSLTS